jgi:hypothetical protein
MEALMQRSKPALSLLCLLTLAIVSFPSCGSGTNACNNVAAITVTAAANTVALNTQVDFTAEVTLSNSTITTNTAVTWQVNGMDGGSSTIGTIVPSTTDVNVGVYTAPGVVPTTNNGQVMITAIITQAATCGSSATATITSNIVYITIGAGAGLAVTPIQETVRAGASFQFEALLNSVAYSGATWTVSPTTGGGSINPTTGLYTAPLAPPPGGTATVSATVGAETATATVTIEYSDASLQGPFAFSYTGDDASGLITVAGSFVADGLGGVVSGVEDITSFGSLVATRVSIISGSNGGSGSNYVVGPDGRTSAVIVTSRGTQRWQFALASTQHALLTRFDTGTTGSGTIDQQNLNALTNSNSIISGPYVFSAAGGDAQFNPEGIAGSFTANGAGGIPESASIVDQNDNGAVKTSDTTLNGSYSFDATEAGTGRGTLNLSSTDTGSLQFAFYVIGANAQGIATHMHIVEIDQAGYLAGDVYLAPSGNPFTVASLVASNYVFTAGGNSSAGSYAEGGVFTSDGAGNISSGVLDTNNAGTATANTTVNQCAYTVDPTTGRIDLKLLTTAGACSSGPGTPEFAVYQTAEGTALMLELDSAAIATGVAYLQQPSPAALSGDFALAFTGQGVFQNAPGSYQSDADGQAVLAGTFISSGNLDINNYSTPPYQSDPLASDTSTTPSSIGEPATNGRGTAILVTTDPPATYNLVYYLIDANTALLLGQDKTRVETGIIVRQF